MLPWILQRCGVHPPKKNSLGRPYAHSRIPCCNSLRFSEMVSGFCDIQPVWTVVSEYLKDGFIPFWCYFGRALSTCQSSKMFGCQKAQHIPIVRCRRWESFLSASITLRWAASIIVNEKNLSKFWGSLDPKDNMPLWMQETIRVFRTHASGIGKFVSHLGTTRMPAKAAANTMFSGQGKQITVDRQKVLTICFRSSPRYSKKGYGAQDFALFPRFTGTITTISYTFKYLGKPRHNADVRFFTFCSCKVLEGDLVILKAMIEKSRPAMLSQWRCVSIQSCEEVSCKSVCLCCRSRLLST